MVPGKQKNIFLTEPCAFWAYCGPFWTDPLHFFWKNLNSPSIRRWLNTFQP